MAPKDFGWGTTAEEAGELYAPHIRGKTILVTGVSPGGLGAYFAEAVAKYEPRLIILAARDPSKIASTVEAIAAASPGVETRSLVLDLSSQEQIRAAAKEVNAYEEPIDVVLNNAGVMACPSYTTTTDGLEMQFAINHIGHFLFTNLIMDKVLSSGPGARIINASSSGHRFSPIRFDDLDFAGGKTYNKWKAYGQSKTANMLFSLSLAEKLGKNGVLSFSVHPGTIYTNLARSVKIEEFGDLEKLDHELGNTQWIGRNVLDFKTHSQGTSTYFVAAFDPEITDQNGSYLLDCQVSPVDEVKPFAVDKVNAERLWELSESIVKQKFILT